MTTDAIDKLVTILETGSGEYINYETLGILIKLAKTIKLEIEATEKLVKYKTELLDNLNENYDKLLAQHESFVEAFKTLWEIYTTANKGSLP